MSLALHMMLGRPGISSAILVARAQDQWNQPGRAAWTLGQLQSSSPERQFVLSGPVQVRAALCRSGGRELRTVWDWYCLAVCITPSSLALHEVLYGQSKAIALSVCVKLLGSCLLYLTLQQRCLTPKFNQWAYTESIRSMKLQPRGLSSLRSAMHGISTNPVSPAVWSHFLAREAAWAILCEGSQPAAGKWHFRTVYLLSH